MLNSINSTIYSSYYKTACSTRETSYYTRSERIICTGYDSIPITTYKT